MPTGRSPRATRSAVLAAVVSPILLAATAAAQTLEEAEQAIRWKLDDEGRVCVSPDPWSGGANDDWRAIGDPRDPGVWANMGLLGNLALLLAGDSDLVSLCDAARFWERLGVGAEDLVRQLGASPDQPGSATARMQRVLAIRAVQDLRHKPAIGPLVRIAESPDSDPAVRRAAEEALADLRGQAHVPPASAPRRLAEVLAGCPGNPTLLVVADQTRIPCARPVMALARVAGLAVTRQAIRDAGGSVSPAMWAGAAMLAEGAGTLPYELARRFGNHRITRTVAALRLSGPGEMPRAWVSFEGTIDVESLRSGLQQEGIPFTEDGGALVVALPGGLSVRISATRGLLTTGDAPGPPMGAEAATELAASLGDLPIALRLGDLPDLSELGLPPIGDLLPLQVAVRPPFSRQDPFEVVMRLVSGNTAGAVAAQIEALPRLVEPMVDDGRLPESVLDALEAMTVRRDGAELRVQLTLPPIDGALVERLVRVLGS